MKLVDLGWTEERARQFAEASGGRPDLFPGRVAVEFNHHYRAFVEDDEWDAIVAGRLKHHATRRSELPAVGDWVVLRRRPDEDRAAIVAVLPREGQFSRKAAGDVTSEQIVATNIDVVLVVTALDADFSPRRVERYLWLAHEGGAAPVVVLTKPDLCPDLAQALSDIRVVVGRVPVHVVNPRTGDGLAELGPYIGVGRTCAVLGSSGVGKSTLINGLVGQSVQRTREVRAWDSKGRHTTIHRELVPLPGGGLLVDTPGMREIQLWDAGESAVPTFEEIESLAAGCRFSDCQHTEEPGCAVKAAVDAGTVSQDRLVSYRALQIERRALAARQEGRSRAESRHRAGARSRGTERTAGGPRPDRSKRR